MFVFSQVILAGAESRQFVTGFFQAIKGNDWQLNPECLGPASEQKVDEIFRALMAADWQKAYTQFASLALETQKDCPINDVNDLWTRLAQENTFDQFMKDIKSNANEIFRILAEANSSQASKTPYAIGKAFGSVAVLVLYNRQQNNSLLFLALPFESQVFLGIKDLKINTADFDIFFKGILTGVSSVSYNENKCYMEVAGSLDEIKAAAFKIYAAVVTMNAGDFAAGLAQLTASLIKIKAYDQNCSITQLIKSITTYSSGYAGLAKLIYNISNNGFKYFDLSKEMIQFIQEKNFEKGGVTSGKIIKILLSWETS